ncbi:RluA family pseudouridine synthase [Candidatus Nitrospira neomarina]|uniref:Pseudouridine synthase n=1 Tax=Candidatus Nitrospira neomarina TaxID=3020899 RepID=A0AA96GKK2_9BACT|nr:RluA family pseudouridine synthase [Candidatus Nitrospira neomarina]WNM63082.1 RluA family pseudouridine synthase [Candidatus Nitrospira neomarina]
MITEFIVTEGETRKRLDQFLVNRERDISRSRLQRLIELGRIRVNDRMVKPSHTIKPGDHITMDVPQPGPLLVDGKAMTLDILHEDEVLLVLNKPAGVVVHPAAGNWEGTVINALLAHIPKQADAEMIIEKRAVPRLVHRLDKDTSGVMVVAKTDHAHRTLAAQFEQHSINRIYEAFVWGVPRQEQGVMELPIGRDRGEPKKVSSNTAQPQRAVTEYRVEQVFGDLASQVVLFPRTGRTHQLRVHLASLGCPILGDETYGGQKVCRITEIDIPRVMLHARTLGFQHPVSGVFQEYSVGCPLDMQGICQSLLNK